MTCYDHQTSHNNPLTKSHYSFNNGCMTNEQRRGVISLIPKEGKNLHQLKNWRPISLLNVDYKIASKAIANRLKKVLNSVISNDQTGFLSNRYIGENIRLVLDCIDYANSENIPGMLLFLDFEKAYDKLEWNFVKKCLEMFGFGESLQKWISLFYTNIESCVINKGFISPYFKISRGLRQGCPLSCYIFILCAEIFGIALRKNVNIKGIKISNSESKLTQFADDTTLILDGSKNSLLNAVNLIKDFGKISGLFANYSKSSILKIGSMRDKDNIVIPGSNFVWTQGPIKFLGVNISLDKKEMFNLNYEGQLQKLNTVLHMWSQRGLTPIGKVAIIKSLAISKITFLLSVLPNPPDDFLKRIEKSFFNFIWNGKQDKIKRETTYNKIEDGGLNMTNIYLFKDAIKISWVKRFNDPDNKGKWKLFFKNEIEKIGGDWIWQCEPSNVSDLNLGKLNNDFMKDVLAAWFKMRIQHQVTNKVIWYNSKIKVGRKSVYYKNWSVNNVNFLSDLIEEGHLMNFNSFKTNYPNVKCNFIQYYGIINNIEQNCKDQISLLIPISDDVMCDHLLSDLNDTQRVCKFAYEKLRQQACPTSQHYWNARVQGIFNSSQQNRKLEGCVYNGFHLQY